MQHILKKMQHILKKMQHILKQMQHIYKQIDVAHFFGGAHCIFSHIHIEKFWKRCEKLTTTKLDLNWVRYKKKCEKYVLL